MTRPSDAPARDLAWAVENGAAIADDLRLAAAVWDAPGAMRNANLAAGLRQAADALRLLLAAAEDAGRLDWIEERRATADYDGACVPPWSVLRDQVADHLAGVPWMAGEGTTLRAAIDAARAAGAGEEP